MSRYTHSANGYTPVAHADGATALANNSYQAVRAAAATQLCQITEFFIGGEATSSTVNRMALRRLSTNGATPTNQTPAPYNINSPVAVAQGYVAATTGPTIASTAHLATTAFNAFGGLIRWVRDPGGEIYFGTTTAPNAEVCLDSISGIGVVSQHVVWEEMHHELDSFERHDTMGPSEETSEGWCQHAHDTNSRAWDV